VRREKIIGSAAPRVGSREKVTGRALYAVDLTLPNMLWGKVLRSPIAYGRIKRIDVCDFFSRWIIAWEVVPTVNGGNMKAIYQAGLKAQGISIHSKTKPELRVDRGSPNTSGVTQEFFEALGAELSFARVRHPTDNALTERFYATVKQERSI